MENQELAAAQAQIDAEYDLADLHEGIKQEVKDECEDIIAAMSRKDHSRWVSLANELLGLNLDEWIKEQFAKESAFGDQLYDFMLYGMYINPRVLMDEILLLVDWETLIEKRMEE